MTERGSTWNIWDLHVHTPESIVEEYESRNGDDKWETFIKDIEKLPQNIKVLGINDYLFLDGYERILKEKENGRMTNIELFLPVVEFRLAKFGGNRQFSRINFHVIFSDKIKPSIIQAQFLNALTNKYKLSPESGIDDWDGLITRDSLELLGKKIKASIPENEKENYDSDLQEGFNNLNLDYSDFMNALENANSYFHNNYITAIGKTEWEDFKWNDNTIAEKKTLINKADFVFTAAESVKSYEKGFEALRNQKVNSKLLDCSDSHRNSWNTKSKDKLGNCFTWIKADTTFEGLKQIKYEFETRVKVSETKPEVKSGYYVLDSIEFSDPKFCNQKIFFNENLNTIIGGRSTGKSTLLRIINAKVKKETDSTHYSKYLDKVVLKWKDEETEVERDIDYFNQGYMFDLSNDETRLNSIIKEIVLKSNYGTKLQDYEKYKQQLLKELNALIMNLFSLMDEVKEKSKLILDKGDSNSIKHEILSLEKKLNETRELQTLSAQELDEYEKLMNDLHSNQKGMENANSKISVLNEIKNITLLSMDLNLKINRMVENYTDSELEKDLNNFTTRINQEWEELLSKHYSRIQKEYKTLEETNSQLMSDELYAKGSEYKENNTLYRDLSDKIEQEKTKFEEVSLIENERQKLTEQITNLKKSIIEKYSSLIIEGEKFCEDLKIEESGLKIAASLNLKQEKLTELLSEKLNMQNGENKKCIPSFADNFNKSLHDKKNVFLSDYLDSLLNEKIVLKSNAEYKSVASELFGLDWYTLNYSLNYQKDSFDEMSPGKKSFVVLKLLLEFSKRQCPILIDQPEDSLDNRAIFNELVTYLKERKTKRQIIIVTHNANIVVSADSEQVIIANKHAKNCKNKGSIMFKYLCGPLENTEPFHETMYTLETQGIREHVCEILEGGKDAFEKREKKYGF